MRPNPNQPTPPNWHTPFDKDDLILHMGASTNLKPTYTSLPSRTSWSSTPCSTHFSSALQKMGIPNHMVFATNSRLNKPRVCILAPRELNVPNHMATQPINCNFIPQNNTMIPYMAQTRYLLNSQILAILPRSIPATLHYSGIWKLPTLLEINYTKWYVVVFYIYYIFYNLAHISFQYISWITSPTQPPLHHLHLHSSNI